jgi:hypothetical protein
MTEAVAVQATEQDYAYQRYLEFFGRVLAGEPVGDDELRDINHELADRGVSKEDQLAATGKAIMEINKGGTNG